MSRSGTIVALAASCFAVMFALSACVVHYRVLVYSGDYDEVLYGEVEQDPGPIGIVKLRSRVSEMQCAGGSQITSLALFSGCEGQRGVLDLTCNDGRRIRGEWVAPQCTRGYGSGYDQDGHRFMFVFGMTEAQARAMLDREVADAKNRPKIPPVKPKD